MHLPAVSLLPTFLDKPESFCVRKEACLNNFCDLFEEVLFIVWCEDGRSRPDTGRGRHLGHHQELERIRRDRRSDFQPRAHPQAPVVDFGAAPFAQGTVHHILNYLFGQLREQKPKHSYIKFIVTKKKKKKLKWHFILFGTLSIKN